jgi:hypothetical protein
MLNGFRIGNTARIVSAIVSQKIQRGCTSSGGPSVPRFEPNTGLQLSVQCLSKELLRPELIQSTCRQTPIASNG